MEDTVESVRRQITVERLFGTLALACAGSAIWVYFRDHHGTNLAVLAGSYLPLAALATLFLHVLTKGNSVRGFLPIGFISIYATMIGTSYFAAVHDNRQASIVASELRRLASVTQQDTSTKDAILVGTNATGEAGTLSVLLQTVAAEAQQLKDDYASELQRDGWTEILSLERIAADPTLVESMKILSATGLTIAKFKKRYSDILATMPARLAALPLTESTRKAVMDGYNKSLRDRANAGLQIWEADENLYAARKEIITFLAENVGSWSLVEKKFVFSTGEDAEKFNKLIGMANEAHLAKVEQNHRISASATKRLQKAASALE